MGHITAPPLSLVEPNILVGSREEREKQDRQRHCHHLVVIPVPEEVDGSVSPALDNGPTPVVYILFTPDLHRPLCFVWSDQVHAAGAVAGFLRREAISEGA